MRGKLIWSGDRREVPPHHHLSFNLRLSPNFLTALSALFLKEMYMYKHAKVYAPPPVARRNVNFNFDRFIAFLKHKYEILNDRNFLPVLKQINRRQRRRFNQEGKIPKPLLTFLQINNIEIPNNIKEVKIK